jgi:hypothetical protein
MSTPVKEKTPLELRAERLLDESMRYSSDEEDEGLQERSHNEPLYSFFRRRIKAQFSYHLETKNRPVKRRRKHLGMTPSPTKLRYGDAEDQEENISPQKRTRSAKKMKVSWGNTPKNMKKLVSEEISNVSLPTVNESK